MMMINNSNLAGNTCTNFMDYRYIVNGTKEVSRVINIIVFTWSLQPKPSAVAIIHQNSLSATSCRDSVAATPVMWQIWWIQVVGGQPHARLHSSPSLTLVQIRRIWLAGTVCVWVWQCSWKDRVFICEQWMRLQVSKYSEELRYWRQSHASCHVECVVGTVSKESSVFQSVCVTVHVLQP